MILVIAEKPSVAQTIAAVLGAKEKKDGFLTGSGYIVSWCVGHLVGLSEAAAYGEDVYKRQAYGREQAEHHPGTPPGLRDRDPHGQHLSLIHI